MYLWNVDGINIYNVADSYFANGVDFTVKGLARKDGTHMYVWYARVNQHGWEITTETITNRRETFQGTTFNLLLEVASAIRRSL